jgi:VanZ family protein
VIQVVPWRMILVAGYMALMFAVSAVPGRWLQKTGIHWTMFDLLHVPLYAGLALVTLYAVKGGTGWRIALTAAICVAFAFSDEWHQSFVGGRVMSLDDVGADALGIALGIHLREGFREN